uniref:Uncharacterized protein n=1 Tax=Phlebotomus papatasi TaxID=29031 RepID=A0A1B0DD86_PHLPP
MDIDQEQLFMETVHKYQSFGIELTNQSSSDDFKVYGLYKQAVSGNCTKPIPNRYDRLNVKKYMAWNDLKGMSQDKAKELYVKEMKNVMQKINE